MEARALTFTVKHGPRADLLSRLLIFPTLAAILISALLLTSPKHFVLSYVIENALVLWAAVVGLVLLNYLITRTEEVRLSPDGIVTRRRFLGDAPLIRWEWLKPVPKGAVALGFVSFELNRPNGVRGRLSVDPVQAREILLYPRCPRAPISPGMAQRLGLSAERSASREVPSPHKDETEAERQTRVLKDLRVRMWVLVGMGGTFWALALGMGLLFVVLQDWAYLVLPVICGAGGTLHWFIANRIRSTIREGTGPILPSSGRDQ